MRYEKKILNTKDSRTLVIRSAGEEDAESLIAYLKQTATETPYLVREPEEVAITLEQEKAFIRRQEESDREIMLIASVDGKHAGNCSITSMGSCKRYMHRCGIAIALLKEFWGIGIGRQLFGEALRVAESLGYEQVELEVITENHAAISLYKSFGFEIYGTLKKDMKYKDGTYSDCYMMVKYY